MVVYIDQFKCKQDIADQFSGFYYHEEEDNQSQGGPIYEEESRENREIMALLNSSEVLLAWYGRGCWDGHAMVVYRTKEGQLYEVNGSHCSCYGLEGRWDPEETNYKALAMRDPSNIDSDLDFIEAYKEMLEILKDNK